MIKSGWFPKIFFGWWTVLAGGILNLWVGGYYTYGFSALFKPIASELGFSRAVISVPAAIGHFEGGLEGPAVGWLTDRFGPRWIIISGVLLTTLSLILMNYIDSLWTFYLVWGIMLGTAHNITGTLPVFKAVTDWFVKKRGIAFGIRSVFSGLSGTLVLPFIAWLIIIEGWRMTCVTGGVVMLVVGLPLAWFCFKQHRPEYYGLLPDGATAEEAAKASQMIDKGVKYAAEVEEVEFTLRQAMRTHTYWLLIIASVAFGLTNAAMNVHTIPFLTDIGIDPLWAAGMMAISIGVGIPVRVVGGLIVDRLRKDHLRFLWTGGILLQAVGFAIFLLNQSLAMIYVWFILYGIGGGVIHNMSTLIMARYFGRKAFGTIRGFSTLFTTPVGIAAPIYAGWIYDTTGSYMTVFILIAGLLAFSAVLMSFILPPKPPAWITDIHKIV